MISITRRAWIQWARRKAEEVPAAAPTDDVRLNAFGVEFNRYIARLESGIRDIQQWKRVQAAWEKLS